MGNTGDAVVNSLDVRGVSVDEPVVVLGFGRSGTTWVADIISRTTGKLVLFEPFHPTVTPDSETLSYGPLDDVAERIAARHLEDILTGRNQRPWLLRNHLPLSLDQVPEDLIELVWKECEVVGFKGIRLNFQIDWLAEHVSRRIAFVLRHPYGVIGSIQRRSNFWEFGWPGTFDLMMERTVLSERYDGTRLAELRPAARRADTDVERIALMWAATHLAALPALRDLGLVPHNYAEFLSAPFPASRKLLTSLGIQAQVHPAQLFSPSMTAEVSAVARHGLVVTEGGGDRPGQLSRADRAVIDRIVDPVSDLIDLGSFNEFDALGG